MRDYIALTINGREHRVRGAAAFATLSNYLRRDLGATGTKIVCEEGDCGACTVLVRRGDGDFLPINSCIQSVAQLDGSSVVTVEGLRMNAVQQSMIAHHGAQCGYCTPGFVVAMSALFEKNGRVDEGQVREGLTGNLCRCTGYEPIIRAALEIDASSDTKLRDAYAPFDARDEVRIGNFYAPATLANAIAFMRSADVSSARPTILQGGTDVGVWVNKRNYRAAAMLSLAKIDELNDLRDDGDTIVAGANVSLAQFEDFIRERIPELHRILKIFGSPQIRNAGTLVGNIANGSPIGDTIPYLFVAGAELEMNGGARVVPIDSFYLGYKKFDLQPDEIITRVRVPVVGSACHPDPERSEGEVSPSDRRDPCHPERSEGSRADSRDIVKLYKVSRRRDLDISAFTAAIRLRTADSHIAAATIAYGGVAPTVVRLPKTEAWLAGKPLRLDVFEQAGIIARGEVNPISDVRGSADYRSQLAENILCKFWYEVFA